jgi:hypothetical protein
MAASASDKARKSYSYLQKTLSVGINASDTALTPNNITSIPTDTGVSFVIDRVDSSGTATPSKRELMTGVVSGATIATLQRGEQGTTAQAHLANAVIEFVNSGEMWNDLIDFLLQDHSNPDGHHKTLTDDNNNEWLERDSTASAVNQVKIKNNITTKRPKVYVGGDDTNTWLDVDGKGTGGAHARNPEILFDFVASGGVWSGDSYGSTRAASMTAMVCYINGRRLELAAVTARTFTASKDTYIDILDNQDGTATIVYTEVTNNAASPALAANSIRIGIIITGAGNIAAAGSVNQGQETMLLPIASSIPYAVTDSLGNLICPRDPNRRILGYREIISDFSTTSTTPVAITGLTVPVIVPTGRKVRLTLATGFLMNGTSGSYANARIFDGSVADANTVAGATNQASSAADARPAHISKVVTPSANSKTYIGGLKAITSGTATFSGQALGGSERAAGYIMVELI